MLQPGGQLNSGNFNTLARALTVVENDLEDAAELLENLLFEKDVLVTGITGPPGAGKSTLVSAMIGKLTAGGKKVAVLAVDPTSPFNFGSLLGDRIRMAKQFNNPDVFIRSVATRGSLGGLSAKTIEMTDVLRSAGFDHIFIETVGVGQSEVEIAGLADITVVVLMPEAGDEVQTIKSGLMEIADIFVVNKSDRAGADLFAESLLKTQLHRDEPVPVLKTTADKETGIDELLEKLHTMPAKKHDRKEALLFEKTIRIIQNKKMVDVDRVFLRQKIAEGLKQNDLNIYRLATQFS